MLAGVPEQHIQIFIGRKGNKAIDVYLDELEMSHVIDFSDRLEDSPLAKLLLQELKIAQINDKDPRRYNGGCVRESALRSGIRS
jgi:hypothetical protein